MKVSLSSRIVLIGILSLSLVACSDDESPSTQCNDPSALNFTPGASGNMNCLYPTSFKTVSLLAELPNSIRDISGLAPFGEMLIGHNDQGNPQQLFVLNSENGEIVHTVGVLDAPNNDWEDLAHNDTYLYIADVGNNTGLRTNLGIHRLPWSAFNPTETTIAQADGTIFLNYPEQTVLGQTNHNFDCEATFYHEGYIYLFMKHRSDNRSNLYRVPAEPGPAYEAELLGGFNSGGRITGADISDDGSVIAILGHNKNANCFVWKFSEFDGNQFLSSKKELFVIGPFSQFGQMESIVFSSSTELYIASERVNEDGLLLPPRLYKMSDF